ncbi:hypothetical protein B0T16DRAFT_249158 [Cercophora newfieldiana]|uniref:Rhodopsin domain-containing protein n=1 Tax=Cercophora newfieldiana TaxID=92897 RepID=A0AA39XUH1_9PEZI|nr:hypothetical protein B0T16DRAFT_249158 [Cercophora newfieldiana]
MASSGTTPSANEDRGQRLLASILSFSALVFVIYLARIWTRLRPKYALTAADYTITVAMVAKTLNIVFLVLAVQNGFGKHMVHIPGGTAGIITVSNLVLGCWMTGVLVSGFGRISIASLLLTLTSSFRWKMLLRLTIALQLLYMLTYEVVQLVQCQNIISSKSRVPSSSSPSSTSSPPPPSSSSQCLSRTSVFVFQLVSISIDMLSDLVCALLPILIVWRLSRSTLEKLLVILLMTSCLAATLCGIPKLYYLVTFDFSGRDQLYDLIPEFFWFRMEEGIVIAAACAPLLKGPVERCMRRVGLPTFGIPTRDLNTVMRVTV